MSIAIRPRDWRTWKYWLHLVIIAVVTLGILQVWQGGDMFNIINILISTAIIGLADVASHTIMGID